MNKSDSRAGAQAPSRNNRRHSGIVGFIGGYLIDQGTLTLEQLDTALLHQLRLAETGENVPLEDVLLRLRMATDQEIASAREKHRRDLGHRAH